MKKFKEAQRWLEKKMKIKNIKNLGANIIPLSSHVFKDVLTWLDTWLHLHVTLMTSLQGGPVKSRSAFLDSLSIWIFYSLSPSLSFFVMHKKRPTWSRGCLACGSFPRVVFWRSLEVRKGRGQVIQVLSLVIKSACFFFFLCVI